MELLREQGRELETLEKLLVGYSMSTPCYAQNMLMSRAGLNCVDIFWIHS